MTELDKHIEGLAEQMFPSSSEYQRRCKIALRKVVPLVRKEDAEIVRQFGAPNAATAIEKRIEQEEKWSNS